jgi:hypothetical protein
MEYRSTFAGHNDNNDTKGYNDNHIAYIVQIMRLLPFMCLCKLAMSVNAM